MKNKNMDGQLEVTNRIAYLKKKTNQRDDFE